MVRSVVPEFSTLPDYLREGLHIISIGLNPSAVSVEAGFYFANPRNRFWRAFNASGLTPQALAPGNRALDSLCDEYGIGFTDLVKRATASGSELKAADYRTWAPVLKDKLIRYAPVIAWFHGKVAYRHYLRHAECADDLIEWGLQERLIGVSRVFVTPNPSPANAAYSLNELVDWCQKLKVLLTQSLDTNHALS